jgi:hypothetical protein
MPPSLSVVCDSFASLLNAVAGPCSGWSPAPTARAMPEDDYKGEGGFAGSRWWNIRFRPRDMRQHINRIRFRSFEGSLRNSSPSKAGEGFSRAAPQALAVSPDFASNTKTICAEIRAKLAEPDQFSAVYLFHSAIGRLSTWRQRHPTSFWAQHPLAPRRRTPFAFAVTDAIPMMVYRKGAPPISSYPPRYPGSA